ncbi:MAG: PVC-type heme-binding CxxCH protein, partial [Chthoniobacteraceae bacterium]
MRSPALLLALLLAGPLIAAPVVQPDEVPHLAPTLPDKALTTFQVRPGFAMQLMAAEPLIEDPVAIAFDEDARLYVVEMRDYSERRDEKLGRVKLLEDTDGDGRYDKASIFAEGLAWPTGIVCWDGGVFVMAAPDLLYFKDMDGDRKADVHSLIFTGFGNQAQKLNVQALPNSLQWGPDQRIHGALGGNASLVTNFARHGSAKIELRGRDFSFDPRHMGLRPESGGGQFGMTFDETGRKFVCANSRHLMQVMYEDRVATKVSDYPLPAPAIDIAADGPQAEVFRRSPEEAWRVIRTKWRTTGVVPGMIEGGGRSSGYFTSASGVTIYKGDAWPAEHRGDVFIADCGSNLIHRKKLTGDLVRHGTRAPGEERSEFVASTDNWFRPVAFANAPDGNLWVIDIYREVIEHPWSLPETLKQHLDLNRGNDRGRLYRLVPDAHTDRIAPRLRAASTAKLVELLQHANGWHRETAARLLHQRQDPQAVAALKSLAADSPAPATRILALHVLRGMDALDPAIIQQGLADREAGVRANAVRLAAIANVEPDRVAALSGDESPRVRAEVGWAMVTLPALGKAEGIAKLLERADSPWLKHSALAAAGGELEIALTTLNSTNTPRAQEIRKLLGDNSAAAPPALPKTRATPRAEAVAKYQASLTLKGDAGKSRATFESRCAVCHRLGKLGSPVGPDLDASRTAGAEKLLGNILEPSRELTAGYPTGLVETKSGETISGILS